jgi:uncharacterized protein YbbK (DUF523 family)
VRLLCSACLLGVSCRYDGRSKLASEVNALLKRHELIPVCPEQLGGLPTPRPPCEIRDAIVISRDGQYKTEAFKRGAEEALRLYHLFGCQAAILKSRSPSCGKGLIYDGTFSGTLISGNGVFAQMLLDEGIAVYTEEGILSQSRMS